MKEQKLRLAGLGIKPGQGLAKGLGFVLAIDEEWCMGKRPGEGGTRKQNEGWQNYFSASKTKLLSLRSAEVTEGRRKKIFFGDFSRVRWIRF